MIEADDLEVFASRILLTADQLVGCDQESIAFRALFARVGDGIGFAHDFSVCFVAAEQQAAAFVRVVANAVFANFSKLFFRNLDHAVNACSMSSIMSSM